MAKLCKLTGKDAEQLAVATIDCLKDWKPYLHTITSDNGKEFSSHQMIATELNIDFSLPNLLQAGKEGQMKTIIVWLDNIYLKG